MSTASVMHVAVAILIPRSANSSAERIISSSVKSKSVFNAAFILENVVSFSDDG